MSDTKALAPMDSFLEKLKAKLRDDIASMLPDDAVQQMVQRVINEEFFTKTQKKTGDRWDAPTVEVPSAFQKMVIDACRETIELHALRLVQANAAAIEAQIKESVENGLMTMALRSLDQVFAKALESHGWAIQNAIENALRAKGLVR